MKADGHKSLQSLNWCPRVKCSLTNRKHNFLQKTVGLGHDADADRQCMLCCAL